MVQDCKGLYAVGCKYGSIVGSGKVQHYTSAIAEGSSVRLEHDRAHKTISFWVNDVSMGVAYSNVVNEDLFVVVQMWSSSDSVSLVDAVPVSVVHTQATFEDSLLKEWLPSPLFRKGLRTTQGNARHAMFLKEFVNQEAGSVAAVLAEYLRPELLDTVLLTHPMYCSFQVMVAYCVLLFISLGTCHA